MRKFENVLRDVIKVCKKARLKYVIVGGVAVSAWGNVRTTRDVDIILMISFNDIKKFVKELNNKKFDAREDEIKEALKEKSHFTIFDKKSDYHIDAKGVYNKNDLKTIENRKKVKVGKLFFYISSPEDLIANKLVFGSEQDIKDAESIFIRQWKRLNLKYLEKRCRELKVYKKFFKIRKNLERMV